VGSNEDEGLGSNEQPECILEQVVIEIFVDVEQVVQVDVFDGEGAIEYCKVGVFSELALHPHQHAVVPVRHEKLDSVFLLDAGRYYFQAGGVHEDDAGRSVGDAALLREHQHVLEAEALGHHQGVDGAPFAFDVVAKGLQGAHRPAVFFFDGEDEVSEDGQFFVAYFLFSDCGLEDVVIGFELPLEEAGVLHVEVDFFGSGDARGVEGLQSACQFFIEIVDAEGELGVGGGVVPSNFGVVVEFPQSFEVCTGSVGLMLSD
jgi:hypothetical protein